MKRLRNTKAAREAALQTLREGGVVAVPTDTLYSLCADALDPAAVARLRGIKGRDATRPFPILLADSRMADMVLPPGEEGVLEIVAPLWPGQLTVVVRGREDLPPGVHGAEGGVGVRVPDSDLVRDLARRLGRPLTGTSANPTGSPPADTADGVVQAFEDASEVPDLLLDGGTCPGGVASTVIDLRGERPLVLREGPVSLDRLTEVLGPLA